MRPGHDRAIVLGLKFADELCDILCYALEGANHTAMSKGAAWPKVHEVVGHISGRDRKIALWVVVPFLLEVDVVATYDREARREGHVEAGGTDDGIHVSLLAVGC